MAANEIHHALASLSGLSINSLAHIENGYKLRLVAYNFHNGKRICVPNNGVYTQEFTVFSYEGTMAKGFIKSRNGTIIEFILKRYGEASTTFTPINFGGHSNQKFHDAIYKLVMKRSFVLSPSGNHYSIQVQKAARSS